MMLWLYLHFPHLQLDGLSLSPTESEQAIIIVEPQNHVVCQLNHIAKAKHLHPGMGLATATALYQPLSIVSYQIQFEQQRLTELANAFYHLTADIALFEPMGMAFAVSPMLNLYQGLTAYLESIKALLKSQDVTAIPALAHSPLAAKILAQSGSPQLSDDSTLIQKKLAQLPVEQLELPNAQKQQLKRIGMNFLSDIKQLPRKDLGARLGLNVLEYLDQLYDKQPTSLVFFKPADYFSQSLILNYEISSSTALLFPLNLLLNKLQLFLRARVQFVQTLFLHFVYRDKTEHIVEIASAEPENLSQNWLILIKLKLETLQLKHAVVSLCLKSDELLEQNIQSHDLFDESHKQLPPKQLLSRLQAKIGQQNIQQIHMHEDHRPEYSFSYQPLNYQTNGNTQRPALNALRPSLLLPEPAPLCEAIRIIHGPERIQCGWWSSHSICRDYFVAKNQQLQTLWVFRDTQQNWFVHGLFA